MKLRSSLTTFGALLGVGISAWSASANSLVTFQVDMSAAINNQIFDPGSQTVSARGTFNNWTAFALTNSPENPALYSGTFDVPANGSVMSYKYTIEPGPVYETTFLAGGHNRLATLPTTSGASLELPRVFFSDTPVTPAEVAVSFQVNMAQQINIGTFDPAISQVFARGTHNGWATDIAMTNDPTILTTNQYGLVSSNVYVATYYVTNSPGVTLDYKFYIDSGAIWESPAAGVGDPADNNNRFYNLAETGTQTLPVIYFNDAIYAPKVTNDVVFQVDMTAQILSGSFDPASGVVELRGNFNNWGNSQIIATNNPASANTNLYTAVARITDGVGANQFYKFWATVPANSGWETLADNRSFQLANSSSQVLPAAYFNNLSPGDVLPVDTTVTFRVDMANAVGTDGHPFDPSVDTVQINGVVLVNNAPTFGAWDFGLPQLVNNPAGSSIYTVDIVFPKGTTPIGFAYKYGINAVDDEAAQGNNHFRFIRSTGSYVMPLDKFGTMTVEPSFGNLQAGPATAGHVTVSWLGRPGVHLQSRSDLTSGSWVDVAGTDGLSSTNVPAVGTIQFFRLVQPGTP